MLYPSAKDRRNQRELDIQSQLWLNVEITFDVDGSRSIKKFDLQSWSNSVGSARATCDPLAKPESRRRGALPLSLEHGVAALSGEIMQVIDANYGHALSMEHGWVTARQRE